MLVTHKNAVMVMTCSAVAWILLSGSPGYSLTGDPTVEPLWFSLAPAAGSLADAGAKDRPVGKQPHRIQSQGKGRPSGRPSGQPSSQPSGRTSGRPASRFESEHRPIAERKYYLNELLSSAKGQVLHPDLSVSELSLITEAPNSASVILGMADGPHHGANNLYVYEKQIVAGSLILRNAKWVTIQHSCGWGHDQKFNAARQTSQSLNSVPLEIVVDNLWDTNFHSTVMSGDRLEVQVLSYGQPASRAKVTVVSDRGWQKVLVTDEQGRASFQMVRDYYPKSWSAFHRTHKGEVRFVAEYKSDKSGQLNGEPYQNTVYNATFAWRYHPARSEYSSLVVGLLIALFAMGLTGAAIFYYRQKRWVGLKKLAWDE